MHTRETVAYSDDPQVNALAGLVIALLQRLGRDQVDELLADVHAQAQVADDRGLGPRTPAYKATLENMGFLLQHSRHFVSALK